MNHSLIRYAIVIAAAVLVTVAVLHRSDFRTVTSWERACQIQAASSLMKRYPTGTISQMDAITHGTVNHKWGVDGWADNDKTEHQVTIVARIAIGQVVVAHHEECTVATDPQGTHIYSLSASN